MSNDIFKLLPERFRAFEIMNKKGEPKLLCSPEMLGNELSKKYNVFYFKRFIVIHNEDTKINKIFLKKDKKDTFYDILVVLFGEEVALEYSLYCNVDSKLKKKTAMAVDEYLSVAEESILTEPDKYYMTMLGLKTDKKYPKQIFEYFESITSERVSITADKLRRKWKEDYNYIITPKQLGLTVNEMCHIYGLACIRDWKKDMLVYEFYKKENK